MNYYMAMIKYWIIHILQVKNYHSFNIQLKNANDTAYVECVKCFKHVGLFIMLLDPICGNANRLNF